MSCFEFKIVFVCEFIIAFIVCFKKEKEKNRKWWMTTHAQQLPFANF